MYASTKKAHIGEVQASLWPEDMVDTCLKIIFKFCRTIALLFYYSSIGIGYIILIL